jgi:hypothetical protein
MKTMLLLLLSVAVLGCGYTRPTQMTQPGIVPAVAALTPASQLHGGSDFTLTVSGSNFNSNAVINWNATPQTGTTRVSATTLSVVVPAGDISTTGTAQVSVTNPGSTTPGGPYGGGSTTPSQTSNAMMFTIN